MRKKEAPSQELDWESTEWVQLCSLFLDESTRERIIACLTQCDQEVPPEFSSNFKTTIDESGSCAGRAAAAGIRSDTTRGRPASAPATAP